MCIYINYVCALSYIITGSVSQHGAVRAAILAHMPNIEERLVGSWFHDYRSVRDYIAGTRMDVDKEWGSNIEIITLANLLNTTVYSSNDQCSNCEIFGSRRLHGVPINFETPAIYIKFVNGNHFQVVTSIL